MATGSTAGPTRRICPGRSASRWPRAPGRCPWWSPCGREEPWSRPPLPPPGGDRDMRRLLSEVKGKSARTQRGIALLLVLWILIVLMGIVLSLSALTRSETHAALAFRTGLENKFLAEAAVEKGIVEVLYRNIKRQSVF